MTVELAAVQAVKTALEAAQIVPDGAVYLDRGDTLPANRLPAIDIGIIEIDSEELGGAGGRLGVTQHEMSIKVDLLLRETREQQAPTIIAAPMLAQIHEALMADRTLGGSIRRIQVRNRRWNFERANGQYVAVEGVYMLTFATLSNSLNIKK